MTSCDEIFALGPVIAVLTIADAADAAPVAEALARGGVRGMEVTLRTPAALEAITAMNAIEDVMCGAGTLLRVEDADRAGEAGARFLVSPGLSDDLMRAADDWGVPILPGVATATEIMRAMALGCSALKFFPAEAMGGAASVAAFAGPFPGVRFCPTGGITLENAPDYLSLKNVGCVGSSWLAPQDVIARRDWAEITRRAKAATALR
ncbi:MAG: bifunctional 4-hydroxy-2-oxoglutarate aldolase/2-dehydro-3-deoxy-phosphogluconate aldolase [Hyphomonadaceae bacterium]